MLREKCGIKKVYLACGYTDLRYGVDGLALQIQERFHLNPLDEGVLFLFCGRRKDRIKGLLWEGDGFLLLYKRLSDGRFRWPNNEDEIKDLTDDQYKLLMSGFTIESTIRKPSIKHVL